MRVRVCVGGSFSGCFRTGHLGHYSFRHTPVGGGFDTFFGFLLGSETHDTHNSWGKHTCNYGVTDLWNSTVKANESIHFKNLTYSAEMYGMEMARLVHNHAARMDAAATPFFLYMAFQNNHAPYTKVPLYDDRFPKIQAGSMKQVYNGNMAAVDDAIGSLAGALAANAAIFGGKTVVG